MIDFTDFNITNWLDTLAHEYRRNNYDVSYQPFTYGADYLPIAANALRVQRIVQIDHDADFILCYQTFAAFTAAGITLPAPNLTVELDDQSSQRQLQNQPTHLLGTFGTGRRPYIYIKPLTLRARSSLGVVVSNLTATATNLHLSFTGVKAYTMRRMA